MESPNKTNTTEQSAVGTSNQQPKETSPPSTNIETTATTTQAVNTKSNIQS